MRCRLLAASIMYKRCTRLYDTRASLIKMAVAKADVMAAGNVEGSHIMKSRAVIHTREYYGHEHHATAGCAGHNARSWQKAIQPQQLLFRMPRHVAIRYVCTPRREAWPSKIQEEAARACCQRIPRDDGRHARCHLI